MEFSRKFYDNTFSGRTQDSNISNRPRMVIGDLNISHSKSNSRSNHASSLPCIPYWSRKQEVILFYNGLDVSTRQILDSKGVIPTKTAADAKANSQSRREIKKVNEKVYAAQVGCELCKGPHYTKDCPPKEERKTLEEAYYTQFGAPYQPEGQYRAAGLGFYQRNNRNSSNNLQVTTMQCHVLSSQQTSNRMQYQNEVNDICAERIAKSANLLALLAAAQPYLDNYYQAQKPQRSNATSSSTRPSASTRHKGKKIAKPVTPQLENKTEDTTPRYNNDNQSGQFRNQRTMTVAGVGETVRNVTDMDEEIDEQELEAHYSFIAKIQEVLPEESSSTEQPLEQIQNNDKNNVFSNERQHSENNTAECVDERVHIAIYCKL
ncbi:integrase, catalytic region, zinc finger, CCHC-type containing protein [Tanacetum coccineum]